MATATPTRPVGGYCTLSAVACGAIFQDASDVEDAVQDVLLTVTPSATPMIPAVRSAVAPGHRKWTHDRSTSQPDPRHAARYRARGGACNLFRRSANLRRASRSCRSVRRSTRSHRESSARPEAGHQAAQAKEMSLKEAARASGRSVGALKVATHRAIANLRRLLRPPDQQP